MSKISICIPAYNRPHDLSLLLDSVVAQEYYDDCEIIVSDDNSPLSDQIRVVVDLFVERYPKKIIRYFKNDTNLGYDGNLRILIERAEGEYCLFMGDDDLLCLNALSKIDNALKKYDNVGVINRTWLRMDRKTDEIVETFRYFDGNRFFKAGTETIITFFRRSVFISGLVVKRLEAIKYSTIEFDGTLLYQVYVAANILTKMNGVYISDAISINRGGGGHYFGSSEKEKTKFMPKVLLPEHSFNFMKGMLDIARWIEKERGIKVYKRIVRDIGNYSYPFLTIHAKNKRKFIKYTYELAKMGLWSNKFFWIYFLILIAPGPRGSDKIINIIKNALGRTPLLGRLYLGDVTFGNNNGKT